MQYVGQNDIYKSCAKICLTEHYVHRKITEKYFFRKYIVLFIEKIIMIPQSQFLSVSTGNS